MDISKCSITKPRDGYISTVVKSKLVQTFTTVIYDLIQLYKIKLLSDKSTENYLDLLSPVTEKELQTLGKSDCLDTLHAIQDLIQQYEGMGEEDKVNTSVYAYIIDRHVEN